ncbi:MAG: hypothetical protein IJN62_04590 [Clostridia bacterium]|nr:hypothetical protein [Clostridia bacterium]
MRKIVAYFMLIIMVFSGTFASAKIYDYGPPYTDTTPDDSNRLWAQMPEPFSLYTMERIEKADCDFNDSMTSATLAAVATPSAYWNQADGILTISKEQTTSAVEFVLKYAPETGFKSGELYAFSCQVNADDAQGAVPKNILACHDAAGKWIQQSGDTKAIPEGGGWYKITQYIAVDNATSQLRLSAYLPASLTGTVHFDDFTLYKLARDPQESILRKPAYKGLIYGDCNGDIVLDIIISENEGLHELDNMSLSVKLLGIDNQIISESQADTLHSTMNFVFSSRGLSAGDYYLQSTLTNKTTGEVISVKEHTLRKRAEDYRPDNYVDENGHYVRGGKKTFFTRINNGSDDKGSENYSENYVESAEFAVETGIDTVSNYALWWQDSKGYADEREAIKNLGITSHISLNSFWYSKEQSTGTNAKEIIPNQTDIPGFLTAVANDFKDDAILEGYYLFDEIDAYRYGEEIRWNNQILAEVDIDHPTFGVTDEKHDSYGNFMKMVDIVGVDPYPVTGVTDANDQPADDISRVGKAVREMKEKSQLQPVYCVLQGFHYEDRGDLRSPDYIELKNMAWQAICEGVDGLDWFSYHKMKSDSTKTLEQWTNDVKMLMADVAQYEDAILSDESAPDFTVSADRDWLNITLRSYNGKIYLFAVNNTYSSHKTTVTVEGMEPLHLSFEPYEVKQLVFERPKYLSPKSELNSMGFSVGNRVFAVSEGEENILYVPAECGVIDYTACIDKGAKLYIGGREMPSVGTITIRNCNRFSVTVLAADGKTKTTKYYNIIK